MGYEEATAHLEGLGVDAMKSLRPTMRRIEALCGALDHPEQRVPAIHVTGTNGKTSTARIITSILAATGLSVGTYTSPHLQSIRERIALNGIAISRTDFGDVYDHLRPFLEITEKELDERLTYFEILTAMFYLWAAESPVDAMVVEVGLGGRWDATNVVPSSVAVITNVGLDHVGLLGTDRETIAKEKAGIVKESSKAVTAERTPAILDVIAREATARGATLSTIGRDFDLTDNRVAFGGRYLSVRTSSRSYEGLFLPLHGSHQGLNAAVGLEAVAAFLAEGSLDGDLVNEGLMTASSPGRLEPVRAPDEEDVEAPTLLLDVAHNPDGVSALVKALAEEFAFERVVFVVGILADKDYQGMLREMARLPGTFIFTSASSGRSVDPSVLARTATELGLSCETVDGVPDAVSRAKGLAEPGDLICVTGSHYVVGEARDVLVGRPQ
jgi:dihydrofolate synthase/folylpolyglutamate synthase